MTPLERQAILTRACRLFNSGDYWAAHEALETVWRSIISDGDEDTARVWQGLIQAAAALLHQQRGNRHGVAAGGRAGLPEMGGPQPARGAGGNGRVPRHPGPGAAARAVSPRP